MSKQHLPEQRTVITSRWGQVKKRLILGIIGLVVLTCAGLGAWVWITLHYTYSAGERTGYIQKISNKGWLCKTWEGELVMLTQSGVPPQIFKFSVRDDSVAQKLLKGSGQRVAISYQQHPGVPTTCFGETEYFAIDVRSTGP